MMDPMKGFEVAVIGGGISGLAAAHRLAEQSQQQDLPIRIHVLEASEVLGGVIRTRLEQECVLEAGPDSMITDKPWGLDLCRRMELGSALVGTDPALRKSFVASRGRLTPVPEGFYLMAPMKWGPLLATPLLSWRGKLRAAREPWIAARREEEDESLGGFVRRRFGREVFERLAEPLLGGIYAADPDELSLNATFPRFAELERRYGSVIRGLANRQSVTTEGSPRDSPMGSGIVNRQSGVSGARYGLFVSLAGGMSKLAERLARALPRGSVKTRTAVTQLERLPLGRWRVTTNRGEELTVDAVCIALPAPAAARVLRGCDPVLEQALGGIAYGSPATVNLVYRRQDITHPLNGFGFVCPAVEHRAMLGCTFSSVKFPHRAPEGWVVLRSFLKNSYGDLVSLVTKELKELVGAVAPPLFTWVNCFDQAMPRYGLGHLERVKQIEERAAQLPGLALAGNAYHGIGLPDCIHSGETAAEALMSYLASRPPCETLAREPLGI